IKTERLTRLQTALWSRQLAFNKSCLGLEMDVLFERSGNRQGQVLGRSPYMQSVYVKSNSIKPGDIRRVRIEGSYSNSLSADIIQEAS
ncbi:MAG: TRAM domain-containing protein, partial [Pseudomonadota bacterium]|nr:TRAM domain-containing protein [Pseudomonadota bacterium]